MRQSTRTRRFLTASTAFAAGGLMLLPVPAIAQPASHAPSAPQITGAAFQIVNVQTGKCATVAGGTTTENNHDLVQFDCDTHPSRRWKVTNFDGSSYQLINAQTGKCATVAGGTSSENNLRLVQFTCDTDPSRRWKVSDWDSSSYQIVNVKTRECATVAGGTSSDNNLQLVQFTCDTDPSRRWTLRLAG